ncbi:hypothetical protein V6N13_037694 [Hibiscus sabdariffa]
MNCQKQIQLRILSEKEGWDLFKANAGLKDGYSSLINVAKEVADECKGLPLAIVTVAKALRDYDIPIETLVICGTGVGLFSNAYSIEDKRREIGVALTNLQSSGLLLEVEDDEGAA